MNKIENNLLKENGAIGIEGQYEKDMRAFWEEQNAIMLDYVRLCRSTATEKTAGEDLESR